MNNKKRILVVILMAMLFLTVACSRQDVENHNVNENVANMEDDMSTTEFSGVIKESESIIEIEIEYEIETEIEYEIEYEFVAESEVTGEELVDDVIYNKLMDFIDQGEIEQLAVMVLQDEVGYDVYKQINAELPGVIDYVMADVLLSYLEFNDAESVVKLRLKGFISDTCFEQYWNTLEYEPSNKEDVEDVDMYLIYELERFIQMDLNGEKLFNELCGLNLFDDAFQNKFRERMNY